jgi:hypothetical protein
MSLKSDLAIDAEKFDRKNIDKETLDFNEKLIKIWADGPRWYEVNTSIFTLTFLLACMPSQLLNPPVNTPPLPSYQSFSGCPDAPLNISRAGRRSKISPTPLGRQNAPTQTNSNRFGRERRPPLARSGPHNSIPHVYACIREDARNTHAYPRRRMGVAK